MMQALIAIQDKECGDLKASTLYGVPKSTLERGAKGLSKSLGCAGKMILPTHLE